jgi:hypothetical protein
LAVWAGVGAGKAEADATKPSATTVWKIVIFENVARRLREVKSEWLGGLAN